MLTSKEMKSTVTTDLPYCEKHCVAHKIIIYSVSERCEIENRK